MRMVQSLDRYDPECLNTSQLDGVAWRGERAVRDVGAHILMG